MGNRETAIEAAAYEGAKKVASGEIDSMEAFNRNVVDIAGNVPTPTKDELSQAYDPAWQAWSADRERQPRYATEERAAM